MFSLQIIYTLLLACLITDGIYANMVAIFEANNKVESRLKKKTKNNPGGPDELFTKIGDEAPDEATFSNDDDVKLFEGDIVYTKDVEDMVSGNALFDALANRQWVVNQRRGYVPYIMAPGHEHLATPIRDAVGQYNKLLGGCVKWTEFSGRQAIKQARIRNYVMFFSGGGCYSNVGMAGGEQRISLGRGCTRRGTVMHEMMHALGFWHEQSRSDRDQHIQIYWENINPRMKYNFQMKTSEKFNQPYDIYSVMHYPPKAFSTNGRVVIRHKGGATNFGWQQNLSKIDIKQLKIYYKCTGTGGGGGGGSEKVNGGWSSWGRYGSCSKKCGTGRQTRNRRCNKPAPKNGGRKCAGSATETRACNQQSCSRCKDDNRYCPYWRFYCTSQAYGAYMGNNCKKTCGKC